MDQFFMDAEINLSEMTEEDTPLEVDVGGFNAADVRIGFGPLRLLLNHSQFERLNAEMQKWFETERTEGQAQTAEHSGERRSDPEEKKDLGKS